METLPTTNWRNLTVDQRHDLKIQLSNRCSKQDLPAPTMELIKAPMGRLHGAVLNFESWILFIKKSPVTASKSNPTIRKPPGIDMGRGRAGPENKRPPVSSRVDAKLKGKSSKESKKPELSEFMKKTPVGPKSTRNMPVESWGYSMKLGEEPRTLPFVRKTLRAEGTENWWPRLTSNMNSFKSNTPTHHQYALEQQLAMKFCRTPSRTCNGSCESSVHV
jgi:hypothetical protein